MGVLLMLITIGGLITAFILLVISIFTKKAWLRKFVFGAVAVWFVFYAILLFGTSLLSKEKTLALNEPKAFCGFYIDCHLHTAVTNMRKTKTIGNKTANGEPRLDVREAYGLKLIAPLVNFDVLAEEFASEKNRLNNERRGALVEAYQQLTGENIESRANRLID